MNKVTKGLLSLLGVGALVLGVTPMAMATPGETGHDPVTFCHKPGTPAAQELTTDDDGFLQGHLGHGDSLGACPPIEEEFEPYTESVRWILPPTWDYGTTPSYQPAIFPQTRGDVIPCDQWSQDDVYLIDTQVDEDLFLGLGDTLTYGEDGSIYQSHVFTKGEPCPPATEYDAIFDVGIAPATCDTGETLEYGDGNLTFATIDEGSTPSGTEGPAEFSVSATPDEGHDFKEGVINPITGTLDGPIGYQSEDPQAECYEPPVILPVSAQFNVEPTPPSCDTAGLFDTAVFPIVREGYTLTVDRPYDGPGEYIITATAHEGFVLEGSVSKPVRVEAALGYQSTDAEAPCYIEPEEPPVTPEEPEEPTTPPVTPDEPTTPDTPATPDEPTTTALAVTGSSIDSLGYAAGALGLTLAGFLVLMMRRRAIR